MKKEYERQASLGRTAQYLNCSPFIAEKSAPYGVLVVTFCSGDMFGDKKLAFAVRVVLGMVAGVEMNEVCADGWNRSGEAKIGLEAVVVDVNDGRMKAGTVVLLIGVDVDDTPGCVVDCDLKVLIGAVDGT